MFKRHQSHFQISVRAIAEFSTAQYGLSKAVGVLPFSQ